MRYVGPAARPLSEFLGWPAQDQAAALSWQAHEAHRCAGCGRHPDDPPRHPHVEICPDCVALDTARKELREEPGAHVVWAHGLRTDCPTCSPPKTATTSTRG